MQTSHSETEQRSPEWFAARKGRITGSAIGAILGLSPFTKPKEVLRRMVREYHGAPSEFVGNAATQWGQFHEEHAQADFEMETGLCVIDCGFFVHPKYNWLGASPDGIVSDGALLEIKCPYSLRNGGEFKAAKDQPHYVAQMQYEMYCTGRDKLWFYQWSPKGSSLECIDFDQAYIDETLPKLNTFYDNYLAELDNPEHLEDLVVEYTGVLAAEEYRLAKAEMEAAKEKMEAAKAQLVKMADGKKAKIDGLTIYETVKKGSVSYAKVVKEHCPDVDLEPYRGKESRYWSVK